MAAIEHDKVIPQLAEHLKPLFDSSPDGVYVWLDETHWTCNENLARMLGQTAGDLENTPGFLARMVHEEDREQFSWNYWNRVQNRSFPVTFRFRGLHRDGSTVPMETEMIPLTYGGHTVAYHFVRRVGA
jgi:PAS domain S-box-containing protein